MNRLAPAVLALLLVAPGCRKEDASFCGTVRALNDSTTLVVTDSTTSREEAERREAKAEANGSPAGLARHVRLLRRLDRTAPAELRADVTPVVGLATEFTSVAADPAALSAVADRLLAEPLRTHAVLAAYRRVRAATRDRCGVALDLEAVDAAARSGVG